MKEHWDEPAVPAGCKPFDKCLFEIQKFTLDCFMLTGDGRKEIMLCTRRKQVLMELAGFANHNGTSCHPSIDTLSKKLCLTQQNIRRYMDDLVALQFLVVGGYTKENGLRVRRLIQPDCDKYFADLDAKLNPKNQKQDAIIREQDAIIQQKQDAIIQKQDATVGGLDARIGELDATHELTLPASSRPASRDLPVVDLPSNQPEGGTEGGAATPSNQNRGQEESKNQKPMPATPGLWTALSGKYIKLRSEVMRLSDKTLPMSLNKKGLPALDKFVASHNYTQAQIVEAFQAWLLYNYAVTIGTPREIKFPLAVFAMDARALIIEQAEDAA